MHLLTEEGQIDGIDSLKVVLTILILRRIDTVDEIIIHGKHLRPNTIYQQLDLQTLGESSLTGRRSTGDKDNLRPFGGDRICYLGDLLLMQSLR